MKGIRITLNNIKHVDKDTDTQLRAERTHECHSFVHLMLASLRSAPQSIT